MRLLGNVWLTLILLSACGLAASPPPEIAEEKLADSDDIQVKPDAPFTADQDADHAEASDIAGEAPDATAIETAAPLADAGNDALAFDVTQTAVMTPLFGADPPATQNGKGHFLQTLVWGNRQWIADSHDGFLHFDMQALQLPLQNWTVLGQPACSRLIRHNNDLWCANRSSWLLHLEMNAGGQDKLALNKIELNDVVQVEGIAAQSDALWLAVHKAGLRAQSLSFPYEKIPLQLPLNLGDVWDLRASGNDRLLLARGADGLAVLDVGGQNAKSPQITAFLPLPGVAAFLQISGNWALVGSLSHGLHVVDISQPDHPKLRGTLKVPDCVHYSAIVGDLILVAGGTHIYAVDVPSPGPFAPLRARAVLASPHYAMDIAAIGNDAVTAEFEMVRRLHLDPNGKADVPLVLPHVVQSPVVKLGDALKATLRMDNVGNKTIVINEIRWIETSGSGEQLLKGLAVPADSGLTVQIKPIKTFQGQLKHKLLIYIKDIAEPVAVRFDEVTSLQAGDSLPALQYQDAKGKSWDVAQMTKGKVAVVLVAAESCPIGFLAQVALQTDLAAHLADGTVAAVAINPWDKPTVAEAQILTLSYPVLYTPLTTSDNQANSQILDVSLSQQNLAGPPMPIVYVLGKGGKIVLAQWGWNAGVLRAVEQALKVP